MKNKKHKNAVLDRMICTDIGGAVNRATHAFGVGLLSAQTYGPMAAIIATNMKDAGLHDTDSSNELSYQGFSAINNG